MKTFEHVITSDLNGNFFKDIMVFYAMGNNCFFLLFFSIMRVIFLGQLWVEFFFFFLVAIFKDAVG